MSINNFNHLKDAKSPYLRQHADDPVEWYPWSEEALNRAKAENKPIIVSIGYSACHWCHVMEKESFEDPETADIMNENFINIKVDREERPDLDSLYLKAVQAMTGHAGWPLTVFANPEGVPFYGGAYFPPDDRFGLPSFKKVLLAVSSTYRNEKDKVDEVTDELEQVLSRREAPVEKIELDPGLSDNAISAAKVFYDPVYGGFGTETKFPHTMFLKFLLKYYHRTGDKDVVNMFRRSLTAMASGAIFDHLGGGFHRYSVDEMWEVPHFEKMLYDNALLSEVYALSYEETRSEVHKSAAIKTLDFLLREMRSKEGGFYSAIDADVEGREGDYYLWTKKEIQDALGGNEAEKFIEYYSVTDEGNYEGKNTLRIDLSAQDEIESPGIMKMKEKLFKIRQKRKRPDVDRKVITGWNGLAITAFTQAARVFRKDEYAREAEKTADFLLKYAKDSNGRLLRYYLDGKTDVKAGLEDYALLAGGLISLYETTANNKWLDEAEQLIDSMVELFFDEDDGLFYDTGDDDRKHLFIRERDLFDNDIPSGNSAAAEVFLGMARHTDKRHFLGMAEEILGSIERIKDEPLSYGNFLCVLETYFEEEGPGHAS